MSDVAKEEITIVAKYPSWLRVPVPFGGYTYRDYKTWDDTIRVELVDGMVYMMASPDEWHQWVSGSIYRQLGNQLEGKKCTPYDAPFDVRLFYEADESDKTVYQPDILVICDERKTKGFRYCKGAPDFIIEIISEYSEDRDLGEKRKKYEKAGVKEYWVIGKDKLHVFVSDGGKYTETVIKITKDLKQPVACLEGCIIDFQGMVDRYAREAV